MTHSQSTTIVATTSKPAIPMKRTRFKTEAWLSSFLLLLLIAAPIGSHAAKTVYVTDNLEILLRSGKGTDFKIISSLETGTPMTVLKTDKELGWTRVKAKDLPPGWVLTRFLTDKPVASTQLESATEELSQLSEKNRSISSELASYRSSSEKAESDIKDLLAEKSKLSQELNAIKNASSNAVQIMTERDQFQERVVNLERELETLKRENQILKDSSTQDWFLIGAGVLFAGIVLGLIIPRLSWKRKTSSWDSF